MFLAVVDSSGNVLQPSYHRNAIFNSGNPAAFQSALFSDPNNPAWTSAVGKYNTLRPRPQENSGFPFPEDQGGDVKNLLGNPGGNDSIWIDVGSPNRTAPNGKTYRAVFAPLIVELDSRLNLMAHGNILGGNSPNPTHVSNTGWGPWSVNMGPVFNSNTEWGNIFTGTPSPKLTGRYGTDGHPGANGAAFTNSIFPIPANQVGLFPAGQAGVFPTLAGKKYSMIDIDEGFAASVGATRSAITSPLNPILPPTGTTPVYSPTYANGYQTGITATQLTNNPLAYNVFAPSGDDRNFSLGSMEALLRFNDTTSYSVTGDLLNLCPNTFGQQRPRNMVTTRGFDVDVPGISPAFTRGSNTYQLNGIRPQATATNFPAVNTISALTNSEFTTGDGRMNYKLSSLLYTLGQRLDLNRPLPEYPQPTNGVIATNTASVQAAFNAAQQARQDLAKDIFDRLRLITGADELSTVPAPPTTSPAKDALRWLAQLSVNIVDFIDDDDIMTPFYWNPPSTTDVVYGVEQPRVLINEVVVQYKNPTTPPDNNKTLVDVWVELMNPGNSDSTLMDSGIARMSASASTGTFNPYQLSICMAANSSANTFSTLTKADNSAGVPDTSYTTIPAPPANGSTSLIQLTLPNGSVACQVTTDFNTPAGLTLSPYNSTPGQGFLVVGNPTPLTTAGATGITLTVKSSNVSYKLQPQTTSPQAPTILLQRLACPYIPFNATSNPYIAIDIYQNACNFTSSQGPIANNVSNPPTNSDNRPNPFMNHISGSNVRGKETTSGSGSIKNTFGSLNYNETGATQWLVQLDRYLSSPMELLHVPGCKPQELTQFFGDSSVTQMGQFNHRVPWFDDDITAPATTSHRLYRFFELVETRSHMAGMDPAIFRTPAGTAIAGGAGVIPLQNLSALTANGALVSINQGDVLTIMGLESSNNPIMENVRVAGATNSPSPRITLAPGSNGTTPYQSFSSAILVHTTTGGLVAGKLNLNTVFDPEIFNGLCDASTANNFQQTTDVGPMFTGLIKSIHIGTTKNAPPNGGAWTNPLSDLPSIGNALGQFPAGDPQYTNGSGISQTLFRPVNATTPSQALVEPSSFAGPTKHPYQRYELLNKIFNNTTSRSNVFAVWLTVGFFEVNSDGSLGAEIGKSEGKSIRHRMFAIVDRSGLAVPRQAGTLASGITASATAQTVSMVNLLNSSAGSTSGINVNSQVIIGSPGSANVEIVTVAGVSASQIRAVFTQTHAAGEAVSIMPGNWGPQPGFDVTQPVNSQIVPYYNIIE